MVKGYFRKWGDDTRWCWEGRLETVYKEHCMLRILKFILMETERYFKILNRGVHRIIVQKDVAEQTQMTAFTILKDVRILEGRLLPFFNRH